MKTVSMQDLLEIYRQKNHCRDIVDARTKLEKVGRDMYEHPDTEVRSKGEYLLLRLQEWDEQQAKQQANTPPPPKQKPYATPQTNGANQAPPQTNNQNTNTQQPTYPADYTLLRAVGEMVVVLSGGAAIVYTLVWVGGAVTGAAKGAATGAANLAEAVVPYAFGVIVGCVGLLGLKEFFTKKETPTTQTGGTGYIVNNYYYGDGKTAERK